MRNSHTDTSVLLIGHGLRQVDLMIETLTKVGAELFFADDANEGLRQMSFGSPDLVICDVNLPDADSDQLCRAIRSNKNLARIPVVFAGESSKGVERIFKTLHAGADDFISQGFNAETFLAKIGWLMQQRSDEAARRKRFEVIRRSQNQTLDIVRETLAVFRSFDAGNDLLSVTQENDERVEVGLSMIAGLMTILEEQMVAVDGWFGSMESVPRYDPELNQVRRRAEAERTIELSLAA